MRMEDGEEELLRPIRAGLLPWSAMNDAAYDLGDFVFANEVLDVEQENQARVRRHAELIRKK